MAVPSYPLFLRLAQCPVLIVGAGAVALRKARGLVESAARVTVVSPEFAKGFGELKEVERVVASYAATHMARKMWKLVFAATNVREVNELVLKHATAAGILCCRCDEPEEGDFAGGAMERLGASDKSGADSAGVTLAVGTSGASPALAARICEQAAAAVDSVLPRLANLTVGWRARVKLEVSDAPLRRALLQRIASQEMEEIVRGQGEAAAQRAFAIWFEQTLAAMPRPAAGLETFSRGQKSGDKAAGGASAKGGKAKQNQGESGTNPTARTSRSVEHE